MSRQSYDNPLTITYNFGLHDFAAGNLASAISAPRNATRCRIEEIHVSVTEVFNAVTTPAYVRIGTASDPDKFAELNMNAAAATDGYGIDDDPDPSSVLTDNGYGGAGVVDMSSSGENIDQLEVVTVQNTGGTPTGIGHLTVTVSWW